MRVGLLRDLEVDGGGRRRGLMTLLYRVAGSRDVKWRRLVIVSIVVGNEYRPSSCTPLEWVLNTASGGVSRLLRGDDGLLFFLL